MFGNRNIKKVQELFEPDKESKRTENLSKKQRTINSNIFNKIKYIEEAEKERIKKEKENEERIKILLERELQKISKNVEFPEGDEEKSTNETSTEELKKDIRLCLEDELTNLEEERVELENTEQLLIAQELADNHDELHNASDLEHSTQLQEIREEICERKRTANNKRKVLERIKHVFDNDEAENKVDNKISY